MNILELDDDHLDMTAATASPSVPTRRLSSRRGSMIAPDPFGQHEVPQPLSSSSRITIVRIPSQPSSPALGPQKDFTHGRRDSTGLARRSSWGSNHSATSSGSMPGRMSFAFSSFTPIHPPSGSTPPASPTFSRTRRSNSSGSVAQSNIQRPSQMTPQQILELAHQATSNSAGGTATPGVATPTAAPFTALPSEVYLPFIHRPQEVSQLLVTPQTSRLFALLASTFPQEPPSRPSSRASFAHSISSSMSSTYTFAELPEDPRTWSFSQLAFWLKCVTRQEANDKEWTRKIRLCINNRSEVLWQRFAGALGVPAGFDEEDDSALADEEDMDIDAMASRFSRHSFNTGRQGSVGGRAEVDLKSNPTDPGDDEQELSDDYDDDDVSVEDSVIVEPIFPSTSPAVGLGLANVAGSSPAVPPSSASVTSLKDLTEVAEEDEGEEEKNDGKEAKMECITEADEAASPSGAATPLSVNPASHMDVPNRRTSSRSPLLGLLPGHLRDHSPRSPSPLIESSRPIDDGKEGETVQGDQANEDSTGTKTVPDVNLTNPTPDPSNDDLSNPATSHHHASSSSTKNVRIAAEPTFAPSPNAGPSTDSSAVLDSEIDFPENPDPNAEPIQGLRITNAPVLYLTGSGPGTSPGEGIPLHHPRARTLSESGAFGASPTSILHAHNSQTYTHAGISPHSSPTSSFTSSVGGVTGTTGGNTPSLASSSAVSNDGNASPSVSATTTPYPNTSSITYITTTRDARGRPASFGQMMQLGMTGGAGFQSHARPYHVNADRGPGNPLFPSSFAGLSLSPTLSANNPQLRNPPHPPASAYPQHFVPRLSGGRRRPPSWAEGHEGAEYALTVASGSSDRG